MTFQCRYFFLLPHSSFPFPQVQKPQNGHSCLDCRNFLHSFLPKCKMHFATLTASLIIVVVAVVTIVAVAVTLCDSSTRVRVPPSSSSPPFSSPTWVKGNFAPVVTRLPVSQHCFQEEEEAHLIAIEGRGLPFFLPSLRLWKIVPEGFFFKSSWNFEKIKKSSGEAGNLFFFYHECHRVDEQDVLCWWVQTLQWAKVSCTMYYICGKKDCQCCSYLKRNTCTRKTSTTQMEEFF